MRALRNGLGLLLTLAALPVFAQSAPNDFQLAQLGNPTPGATGFSPVANGNFQAFARELGAGIASSVLQPVNSLGLSGFDVELELSTVFFDPHSSAFHFPTAGTAPGAWLMPGLHVRKGLPLSFEIGARAAWLGNSGMATAGVEGKWTLTEGGTPWWWPAVSLRGNFTKLFNTQDFQLQTGGLDLCIGKRFAFAGMLTLSPYLGYALGWTYAVSNAVNFNPARSEADSERTPADTFVDTAKFKTVAAGSNPYNRVYLGGRFQGNVFNLGAEVSLASVGSFGEPGPDGTASTVNIRSLPVVVAVNVSAGIAF